MNLFKLKKAELIELMKLYERVIVKQLSNIYPNGCKVDIIYEGEAIITEWDSECPVTDNFIKEWGKSYEHIHNNLNNTSPDFSKPVRARRIGFYPVDRKYARSITRDILNFQAPNLFNEIEYCENEGISEIKGYYIRYIRVTFPFTFELAPHTCVTSNQMTAILFEDESIEHFVRNAYNSHNPY